MYLAGIDLAWQSERNSSGIAISELQERRLELVELHPPVFGIENVARLSTYEYKVSGIAIDAPLIINNDSGQRVCEKEVGREYGSRGASCHTSNLSLYPNARSVALSKMFEANGYVHLDQEVRWQIECYPHPAIIEIFGLEKRLAYKKGRVADKKTGQVQLSRYITLLKSSNVLNLELPERFQDILSKEYIFSLKGKQLKQNEDCLDAIVCLYIAGLYQKNVTGRVFGNSSQGYIYVPQRRCI